MKQILGKIFLSVAAIGITACQTLPYQPYARDVKKKPRLSGVIALKTNHRDEDSYKAEQMMKSNCGELAVKVLEEGEVEVGQETKTQASTQHEEARRGTQVGTFLGLPVTSGGRNAESQTTGVTSTVAVKEWQIQYECEQPVKSGNSKK